MKKRYTFIMLVLIAVLIAAGCAPSWQPPIMGPDRPSNGAPAPAVTSDSASRGDSREQVSDVLPKPVVAAPTEVSEQVVEPSATLTAQPVVEAPTSEPSAQPVAIRFRDQSTTTTVEGVLRAGESDAYTFEGSAEQMVTIGLNFVDVEPAYTLSGVDSGKPVKGQDVTDELWSAILPQTQAYLLVIEAPQELPLHVSEIPYHVELTVEDLPFGLPPPRPELVTQSETLVYEGPGRDFAAVHALPPQRRAQVLGRNLDNSWLAIAGPGDGPGEPVWVAADDVTVEGDVHLVPILEQGS